MELRDVRGRSKSPDGAHRGQTEPTEFRRSHRVQTEPTEFRRSSWRTDLAHRGFSEDRGS